jgi:hypothetical protein
MYHPTMGSEFHRYRLGPFVLASEIPLPELTALPAEDAAPPNAWIRLGNAPHAIPGVVANETRWWASATEYLQRVPDVATFHVHDGCEIVVEPAPGSLAGDIRAYLLAPIFSQLCFQTGRYALHASSVRIGDGVVAFLGDSGAGKSTLAAGLERRGHSIISDDMCLLETGLPLRVIPVAPALKLWPSALRHLGTTADGLPHVWSKEEKFRMRITEPKDRLPLRAVVFLEWADDMASAVRFEPLYGATALARLLGMIHFEYLVKPTGRRAECFRLCGEVLRQAEAFVLRRPRDFLRMDETTASVEGYLESVGNAPR